ncbi:MAG: pyruvate kinase [Mycobacterium leprae]
MDGEQAELIRISTTLDQLRSDLVSAAASDQRLAAVHPSHRASAENLAHYVALRQRDVRHLQVQLARRGLSSLGRAESHVLATLDAVRRAVAALAGIPGAQTGGRVDFDEGARMLDRNATALLGRAGGDRRTRIMVTLPSEAAVDPDLARRLVAAGAELVRINCAHDGPEAWAAMVRHVRDAEAAQGRRVRVVMDLAGPKLRTGAIRPDVGVLRLRPQRDALGRPVAPAVAWLTTPAAPPVEGAPRVPVEDRQWLSRRRVSERIRLLDTRRSRRTMRVTSVRSTGVLAELDDTTYLVAGTRLVVDLDEPATVADLPPRQQRLILCSGDELVLVPEGEPADPTRRPPTIGCTLPRVFEDARVGDRVFFDDGSIGGVIESVAPAALGVRIIDAAPRGSRLAAGKGINLPDTTLALPSLSEEDLAHLPFVVRHADAVSLSFTRTAEDVAELQSRLDALGGQDLGLVLKVETVAGFENLPDILVTAMRSPRIGVMIARGDLAVEAGYARLAEVQEEILWLCEAARVPVIWATQVLDILARTGRPSRAEVTDAAMSGRAECVMLNKGPYAAHAVAFLDDILSRMAEHQRKKSALLRRLRAWDDATVAEDA